jgi:peptidoglycan/xylan/chitin deacetylase (PgdA/CDA1 family)
LVSDIAEMEERLGLRSAWYFIPYKYKLDQKLIADLKARGHEVGIHGYNHDGRLFTSKAIFSYRANYINKAGRLLQAKGFRAPMVHRNLEWMQQLEFAYDASCFDIDPFQSMPGGVGGVWPFIVGKLVELPYTLPQDHTLLVSLGQPPFGAWVNKMNVLKRLAGMAMLITHPDYLTTVENLGQYQRFCEHAVSQKDNPWLCLPRDIALWWRCRQDSSVGNDGSILGPASARGRTVELTELFQDLLDD